MRKVYHLSTCSTCIRTIKNLGLDQGFDLQDIKTDHLTAGQLDQIKNLSGSYESLFSRRAMKYKSMGLGDQNLGESDYRKLILSEYTFLKRPVVLIDDQIFIGNSTKVQEAIRAELTK